jgi:predicted amidophosphoribosyltransferase
VERIVDCKFCGSSVGNPPKWLCPVCFGQGYAVYSECPTCGGLTIYHTFQKCLDCQRLKGGGNED